MSGLDEAGPSTILTEDEASADPSKKQKAGNIIVCNSLMQDWTKVRSLKIGSTVLPFNVVMITSDMNFNTTTLRVTLNGIALNDPSSQLAIDVLQNKIAIIKDVVTRCRSNEGPAAVSVYTQPARQYSSDSDTEDTQYLSDHAITNPFTGKEMTLIRDRYKSTRKMFQKACEESFRNAWGKFFGTW